MHAMEEGHAAELQRLRAQLEKGTELWEQQQSEFDAVVVQCKATIEQRDTAVRQEASRVAAQRATLAKYTEAHKISVSQVSQLTDALQRSERARHKLRERLRRMKERSRASREAQQIQHESFVEGRVKELADSAVLQMRLNDILHATRTAAAGTGTLAGSIQLGSPVPPASSPSLSTAPPPPPPHPQWSR